MNTIIYGGMRTGKTLLAEALKAAYKKKNEAVEIIEDSTITLSKEDYMVLQETVKEKLEETKDNPDKHIIVTTQAYPEIIFGFYDKENQPRLYDYYIKAHK